jgi:peptidoglycan/LPS O-acetylase OafA/YrhL
MRTDIQLLRSFAVLSVILFHFDKNLFPNGYLGVDIFFVISGYLIFNKIREQVEKNNFKLRNFYFKRFKRIFPSLLTTSIFTLVLGLFNLSLEHLYELIRGLKYSIFFVGNIYFSQMFNYFSIDVDRNLIINLWSLSVEEQFYIIFPIFVILIYKFRKPFPKILILLALIISVLACTVQFYNIFSMTKIFFNFDNYIFYSPFTRGWQLLLGAFIPYSIKKYKYQKQIYQVLTVILLLLLFANFKFYNQLITTFITAVLLMLSQDFKKGIVVKIFKHIGDISYSLYLFHQPILAATRNHYFYKGGQIQGFFSSNLKIGLALVVFIYLVALINFNFVENKFVKYKKLPTLSKVIILSIFSILLTTFLRPSILTASSLRSTILIENVSSEFKSKPGTNYLLSNVDGELCINRFNLDSACKFGEGGNKLYFLGDSIISSLVGGFLQEDILSKYTIIEFTRSGCYPIYNYCDFVENSQFEKSIESIVDSVIIFGGEKASKIENIEFSKTIKKLISQNNKIIYIGYIPFPEIDENMYFIKNKKFLNTGNQFFYKEKVNEYETFINSLQSFEATNFELKNFYYIDTFKIICPSDECNYILNDKAFFIDGYHFSYYGSRYIIDNSNIKQILNEDY